MAEPTWAEIVRTVSSYVKDATGWEEFDAEDSMTGSQIQEMYDDIDSED